jgi:hypothetical protein
MVFNASKRRQYHSCDRCRKGHRSCDANTTGARSLTENALGINIAYACSACRRANKACTFEWLRSISPSALPASQRSEFVMPVRLESNITGLATPHDTMESDLPLSAQVHASNEYTEPNSTSTYATLLTDTQILPLQDCRDEIIHNTTLLTPNNVLVPEILPSTQFHTLKENTEPNLPSAYISSSQSSRVIPLPDGEHELLWNTRTGLNPLSQPIGLNSGQVSNSTQKGKFPNEYNHAASHSTTFDFTRVQASDAFHDPTESWNMAETLGDFFDNTTTMISTERTENRNADIGGSVATRGRRREQEGVITDFPNQPLAQAGDYISPASKRKRKRENFKVDMAETTIKLHISSSLLKIFEETCENATFCWTTVTNCPFKIQIPSTVGPIGATTVGTELGKSKKSLASGGLWSRAIKLDRKFQSLRPQPLSDRELFQASNTLKLSIMTFASQWGVERKAFGSRSKSSSSFAHLMYRSLWNEASRALDRCSHLNSFRVIFSALMLALVIEPMDDSSASETPREPRDWRPIAFKHLLFWNQQLSNGILIRSGAFKFKLNPEYRSSHKLTEEDIEDFFLAFWLALAYDSIISVLVGTPFSLRMDLASPVGSWGKMRETQLTRVQSTEISNELVSINYWNVTHLHQTEFTWSNFNPSSPSTIEMIETALQDTVPSIMLHWRNIGTLRNYLKAKNVPPEDLIRNSLKVFNHWKHNSEIVMKYCLENYSKLPFKIQTWYIYNYANWSSGCFILTDIMEEMDILLDTDYYQQFWTMSTSSCTYDVKKHYAFVFSSLAQVLSENDFIQPGYHEFITESGAQDGMPWPTTFSLCLAKTCEILLNWIHHFNQFNHDAKFLWILQNVDIQELISLSKNCIEQLKELGWKSPTSSIQIPALQSRFDEVTKGYLMVL